MRCGLGFGRFYHEASNRGVTLVTFDEHGATLSATYISLRTSAIRLFGLGFSIIHNSLMRSDSYAIDVGRWRNPRRKIVTRVPCFTSGTINRLDERGREGRS